MTLLHALTQTGRLLRERSRARHVIVRSEESFRPAVANRRCRRRPAAGRQTGSRRYDWQVASHHPRPTQLRTAGRHRVHPARSEMSRIDG
jgi:hypothetical protein